MNILVLLIIFLFGCQSKLEQRDALQKQIVELNNQADDLNNEIVRLRNQTQLEEINLKAAQEVVAGLRNDATVLQAEKDRKKIHCIVKLSLRQVSYTLNVRKKLRDAANEQEFELPIDCSAYESLNVDDNLFEKVRAGSAILYGSLGSWHLKVLDKRMVIDQ